MAVLIYQYGLLSSEEEIKKNFAQKEKLTAEIAEYAENNIKISAIPACSAVSLSDNCKDINLGEPLFVNVSYQAGITHNRWSFDHSIGIAWGDYDNDGWVDLYVTDSGYPNTRIRWR